MIPTPSTWPPVAPSEPLAVLISGGLDSAVLLAEAASIYPRVQPIYVRTGAAWEEIELANCRRFIDALQSPILAPLAILNVPTDDIYGAHWSMTGEGGPEYDDPDETVYLPGRNIILLTKALILCHLRKIPEIAMAPLEANPFPDATPGFFLNLADAIGQGVNDRLRILTPYAGLKKTDVILRGRAFPLQHTFSCMRPLESQHCGRCSKCKERQVAFLKAGVSDPTTYTHAPNWAALRDEFAISESAERMTACSA